MTRRATRFFACLLAGLCLALLLAPPAAGQAQSNAGDLVGMVTDPDGARIPGATVTVRNLSTNLERSITTDAEGAYRLLVLPPGKYEVRVEAPGFAPVRNPEIDILIGATAEYNVGLEIRAGAETIIVTTETSLIESQRTAVADTITPRQIENLPINQRDYLNFTLLTSTAARDSAPSIGAAPTSGLNFGGQRGRSNLVSVDGADATDNSVNGVRSTVSQEAVQEFQLITNSYMPEFGRASGGVVNIVTRGGTNDFHGNIFGFIRNRNVEARNPFSTVEDPAFTRFQGGATLGGPIQRDRTFFFFAYETRRREEEGFSSIGADNFGLVPTTVPTIPVPLLLTPGQAAFVNSTLAVDPSAAITYAAVVGTWSSIALGAANPGFLNPLLLGTPTFFDGTPLPASFTALNALRGNYPVDEATTFWSGRIDHRFNDNNNFFVRANVTPSTVRGIQVNAQNQTFGQNSFSRSSEQSFRDLAVVAQNVTTIGSHWVNEARFQFARRGLSYTPSRAPGTPGEPLGGEGPGINIGGFAFFGREPFSRVDRIERRYQWTDNVSYLHGHHTFKFGSDTNFIQIRPRFSNDQVFELNFGSVINFGALTSSQLAGVGAAIPAFGTALGLGAPGINAAQAYGFGVPQSFIQGIGDSFSSFNNTAIAFYGQDTWRVRPNLTLNYGVRWEGEATPRLPAFNALTAQAEDALGVMEGIPRDWNNVQPRIGLAWDPWNDGKTVVRAAYGVFFDHPLLALAFNSDTADGAQSTQQILFGGTPCATSILLNPACLNAASIFQGILNAPASFGFQPGQQRFDPFTANSIFINQNFCPQPSPDPTRQCAGFPLPILPFTLPVAQDFVYAYAQQWNLTVEREIAHDLSFSIGYQGVKGSHLNRPRNINAPSTSLLVANANNAIAAGLFAPGFDPRGVQVPVADPGICGLLFIPAVFCLTNTGVPIATPAAFNFFRPSGPNFAFTGGLGIPDAAILAAAQAGGFSLGPGFFVPFSDVNQQESTGSSIYHGLTVNLRKRYGHHYQFLASYTWSHAIDNSTDLQTLLNPQDNQNPQLERGDSTFDQRHRFILNAILDSPYTWQDEGFWHKFFADFTVAPVFEAASGRPFTALTGVDANLDFGPNTDRPTVVPVGTPGSVTSPFLDDVAFLPGTVCPTTSTAATLFFGCTGTLGRNTFNRPEIWNLDLRVARRFFLGERWKVEFITDIFNVLNRFNIADVNPLCDPIAGRCIAGQPTAALDARQFQFGLKLSW
ncbi:MAG: TonB-dependent receptor domain-containing protein [Terriglobia bacterium]